MVKQPSNEWRSPLIVIIAGCLISVVGFGVRSSLGLFLEPITIDRGFTRETFGFALALQNLLWGIGLPVAGMIADKYGASRVIASGAVLYAAGLFCMGQVDSPLMFYLTGGVLSGLGIAFSAFSLAMAAMVKVVGPEKRTIVLGLGTAAGSLGQVIFSPLAQGFIQGTGWVSAFTYMAFIVLSMLPLAWLLPAVDKHVQQSNASQSIGQAIEEAAGNRGYVLLTTGFFVCGFHVAFITVHFPAYINDLGFDAQVGAWSLSLIGLFNIAGAFLAGVVGQRFSKKYSLSSIYTLRALLILALLILPKSPLLILIFAGCMGVLWLSTVPLTTGIIADVFGTQYMATLFGIVFFSHQLGSFLGVWLGGALYDATGSYDGMWWAGVVLGLIAALIHLPINEKPLPRLALG